MKNENLQYRQGNLGYTFVMLMKQHPYDKKMTKYFYSILFLNLKMLNKLLSRV